MLVLYKPQQRNLDVWIYLLAISFLCSVAKERFQTQLFKAWVLTQPYFENSKKKSISYWKGPFSDYFKRANVQHFSLYVEKVWNSCLTHFFFENMIKLKIQKLEEEFNCRIEMLAVQMALFWPCFLFQQVPLARIFFGHCYHSTVVTSPMYVCRKYCMNTLFHFFLGGFFARLSCISSNFLSSFRCIWAFLTASGLKFGLPEPWNIK